MSSFVPKILVVDDEQLILDCFKELFATVGFDVLVASGGEEALKILAANKSEVVLILSDYRMPSMNGFEFREKIPNDCEKIPFVVCSAFVSKEMASKAVDLQIQAFINKPVNEAEIIAIVKRESRARIEGINERKALEETFLQEASQILEEVEPLILQLEDDPNNPDIINAIFRNIHTVKGSAGVLEDQSLSRFAHKFEDLLSAVKNGTQIADRAVIEKILYGVDKLKEILSLLRDGRDLSLDLEKEAEFFSLKKVSLSIKETAEPIKKVPTTLNQPKAKENISVPRGTLDELLMQAGEITVIRNMVNRIVRQLEKTTQGNRDVAHLSELLDEMHKINGVIQNKITDLRKVSLSSLLRSFPRTIRDLSQSLNKPIELKIVNADLRVDTVINQALSSSLIHLVRNAADHGIEGAQQRKLLGKPAVGKIVVECVDDKDEIIINLSDDGKGISRDNVCRKAIREGLITAADAEKLPDSEIHKLIFASGFSTAETVSGVSGRGVGMDMVKNAIESVGGRIEIESKLDVGTTFKLYMHKPKSVLIVNSLLVAVGVHIFAIPQDCILRLITLNSVSVKQAIQQLEGRSHQFGLLQFDNDLIPVIDVHSYLNIEKSSNLTETNSYNLVVIKSESGFYALLVDQILDAEEIVAKTLHPKLEDIGVYSAATFNGDGSIGLILDINKIGSRIYENSSLNVGKSADLDLSQNVSQAELRYLLFELDVPGNFAVEATSVHRIELLPGSVVKQTIDGQYIKLREELVPVFNLSEVLSERMIENRFEAEKEYYFLIFTCEKKSCAFLIKDLIDISVSDQVFPNAISINVMISSHRQFGERIAVVLNVDKILEKVGLLNSVKNLDQSTEKVREEKLVVKERYEDPSEQPVESVANETWGLF
jgi:two-component system chemotaxis sensor kinase CheA